VQALRQHFRVLLGRTRAATEKIATHRAPLQRSADGVFGALGLLLVTTLWLQSQENGSDFAQSIEFPTAVAKDLFKESLQLRRPVWLSRGLPQDGPQGQPSSLTSVCRLVP